MSRADATGPSLKHFILRAQVLRQYRVFLRLLHAAGLSRRADLRSQLRAEFRQAVALDPAATRAQLAEGERQLTQLRKHLGLARPDAETAASSAGADFHKDNVNDESRGRIGDGWPWMR